jgi:hypothetical protein
VAAKGVPALPAHGRREQTKRGHAALLGAASCAFS